MQLDLVDKAIVQQVNKGSEQAFAELYKAYYAYLNAVAIYYLQDKEVAQEVVDDVFLNVWEKRENLIFPIHYYLVRSVQNGCLNYIRSQRALQTALDGHRDEVLFFLEEHILSTSTPLEDVELKETEAEIRRVVDNLPIKMRAVFEAYFYDGKSAEEIAEEMNLSVNTIRVQIKNALDKLKQSLKHLLFIIFFI